MKAPPYKAPCLIPGRPFLREWIEERRLNEAFALIFAGPPGQMALESLRAETQRVVVHPPYEPGTLEYIEGARGLFQLIVNRIEMGKERKPDEPL